LVEASSAVRHQVDVEKETVRSAGILMASRAGADKGPVPLVGSLDQHASAVQVEVKPVPLADVIAYFEAAQKLGAITLTEKPKGPPPADRRGER
jgi:hypothetical protein